MIQRRRRLNKKELLDTALSLQGNYSTVKKIKKQEKKAYMSNKYLEKIATFGEVAKGFISPDGGGYRAGMRGNVEGLGAGAVGAGLGAGIARLLKKDPGASALASGVAGLIGGSLHGVGKSFSNQAKEMHHKYAEIEGTIIGPKAKAKKVLDALEKQRKAKLAANIKLGGKVGAGVAAAGVIGYGAKKLLDKKDHEKRAHTGQCLKTMAIEAAKKKAIVKQAGLVGAALTAAKSFGRGAVADASKLGGQIKNVGTAYKANKGLFNPGTMSTVRALGKNKALQAGAGLAAGGYVAGRAMNKQSSLADNKYLQKVAMFGGFGDTISSGMASMGKSLSSLMPQPSMKPTNLAQGSTLGVRG